MLHKHGVFPQGAKVVLVPLLLHRGELTPLGGSWSRFGSGFCFCLVSNPKKNHPLMNPEVWDLSTSLLELLLRRAESKGTIRGGNKMKRSLGF